MWGRKAPAAASPPRQPNDTEFPKPDFKEHTFWGPTPDLLNPSPMVETENLFLIIFFFVSKFSKGFWRSAQFLGITALYN